MLVAVLVFDAHSLPWEGRQLSATHAVANTGDGHMCHVPTEGKGAIEWMETAGAGWLAWRLVSQRLVSQWAESRAHIHIYIRSLWMLLDGQYGSRAEAGARPRCCAGLSNRLCLLCATTRCPWPPEWFVSG